MLRIRTGAQRLAYQTVEPPALPAWVVPNGAHRAQRRVARCALLVMNPRRIPQCVESIRDLPVDQYWLTGYYERQLVDVIGGLVRQTRYDTYAIVSDDCQCDREAWAAVRDAMDDYPVVTGWCQVDGQHKAANVSVMPLKTDSPAWTSYSMPPVTALVTAPPVFRSWWIGFALSAMRREYWERFPFDVYPSWRKPRKGQTYPWGYEGARDGAAFDAGESSDYHLSLRLQQADVPVWAVRDAQVGHLRRGGSSGGLVNGEAAPGVTFRPWR